MKRTWIAVSIIFLAATCLAAPGGRWVKGNTHAHTRNSDGNETPRRVVRWYQDYGYQFLFITDHDMITETAALDSDKNDDFILIPGQEITRYFGKRPAHVNALNPKRPVADAAIGATLVQTLQNGVDAARAAGALPQVNHPNWKWSFGFDEMKELRGVILFELLNVNRDSNNFSAGGKAGTEETLGRAALAPAGSFTAWPATIPMITWATFSRTRPIPARAGSWRASAELTPDAVCAALEKGDFYASTGVELADVQVTDKEYRLAIAPLRDTVYTTRFIGKGGVVLKKEYGLDRRLCLQGRRTVRARQGVFLGRRACLLPAGVHQEITRISAFLFSGQFGDDAFHLGKTPLHVGQQGELRPGPLQVVPRLRRLEVDVAGQVIGQETQADDEGHQPGREGKMACFHRGRTPRPALPGSRRRTRGRSPCGNAPGPGRPGPRGRCWPRSGWRRRSRTGHSRA